ncbi:uncharacterized protein CLUP02_15142 [Colletotrichum lupini]|uniref:Uncharacterized protein n=1 Tax=Colletotrichum lupini TaxID=145971 RepID=A0A9Q8T5J1_9PEZI|nr:uncharacterized protein CLUP02_15142 [Colletotrichum lupini]UQC89611.1 hypothetical protein CLUP02_15142 [Colletotrichum lupini]
MGMGAWMDQIEKDKTDREPRFDPTFLPSPWGPPSPQDISTATDEETKKKNKANESAIISMGQRRKKNTAKGCLGMHVAQFCYAIRCDAHTKVPCLQRLEKLSASRPPPVRSIRPSDFPPPTRLSGNDYQRKKMQTGGRNRSFTTPNRYTPSAPPLAGTALRDWPYLTLPLLLNLAPPPPSLSLSHLGFCNSLKEASNPLIILGLDLDQPNNFCFFLPIHLRRLPLRSILPILDSEIPTTLTCVQPLPQAHLNISTFLVRNIPSLATTPYALAITSLGLTRIADREQTATPSHRIPRQP